MNKKKQSFFNRKCNPRSISDKKGAAMLIVIVGAVLIALFFLITFLTQECRSNDQCAADSYCGADNKCHTYPDEIVVKEKSYLSAAIVLGVALIIAAYIFRKGKKERKY